MRLGMNTSKCTAQVRSSVEKLQLFASVCRGKAMQSVESLARARKPGACNVPSLTLQSGFTAPALMIQRYALPSSGVDAHAEGHRAFGLA